MAVNLAKGLAPVVIFGYNRPQHILKTLDALNKNELADQTDLHIFLDAPKSDDDQELVNSVGRNCHNFHWVGHKKVIHQREENLGLARNIIDGITEIIQQYERVIVLEDDIITSEGFLAYMNEALNLYQGHTKVMHINSYLPETKHQGLLPNLFFTRFMNCWGWATWQDRWEKFEGNATKLLESFSKREDREEFNFHGAVNFDQQLMDNVSGKLNTWAVKWNVSIFLNEGLCLSPSRSLVCNIGLDGSGVHYNNLNEGTDRSQVEIISKKQKVELIPIKENKLGRIYLGLHYGLGREPSIAQRAKFFGKRLIKKGRL